MHCLFHIIISMKETNFNRDICLLLFSTNWTLLESYEASTNQSNESEYKDKETLFCRLYNKKKTQSLILTSPFAAQKKKKKKKEKKTLPFDKFSIFKSSCLTSLFYGMFNVTLCLKFSFFKSFGFISLDVKFIGILFLLLISLSFKITLFKFKK